MTERLEEASSMDDPWCDLNVHQYSAFGTVFDHSPNTTDFSFKFHDTRQQISEPPKRSKTCSALNRLKFDYGRILSACCLCLCRTSYFIHYTYAFIVLRKCNPPPPPPPADGKQMMDINSYYMYGCKQSPRY